MTTRNLLLIAWASGMIVACSGGSGGGGSSRINDVLAPASGTNTDSNGYVLDGQGIANPWLTAEVTPPTKEAGDSDPEVSVDRAAIRMGLLDDGGNRDVSADGSGQRIAYYDNEFNEDHEQLTERRGTTTRQRNYHNLDANEELAADIYGHGTFGASLAAGRYGVAPGADLDLYAATNAMPNRFPGDPGLARSAVGISDTPFVDDAISRQTDVINYSFGTSPGGGILEAGDIRKIRDSGMVFVKAAGNSSDPVIAADPFFTGRDLDDLFDSTMLPQADLARYLANDTKPGGLGVLVGAANEDYTDIASFSNRPGGVKDRSSGQMLGSESFITAPGTRVPGAKTNSTATDNQLIGELDGTSFAAPIVTGTVALMLERWEQLTPDEVVGLMFETADRDFPGYQASLSPARIDEMNARLDDYNSNIYGRVSDADITLESDRYDYTLSPVFGHGLLDIQAALSPQGTPIIATGTGINDGGIPVAKTTLVTGPAFGDGLANTAALAKATFIDGYGRDFAIDMNAMVTPDTLSAGGMDYGAALGSLVAQNDTRVSESAGGGVSMRLSTRGSRDALGLSSEGRPQYEALSAEIDYASGLSIGAYQANTASAAPWASDILPADGDLLMGVQGDGYLAAWDQASAVSAGLPVGDARLTLIGVYADHDVHTDAGYRRDGDTATRQIMRLDTGIGETRLQLGGGAVFQDDRLFGGRAAGAFGFGEGTTTYTTSIGAARDIGGVRVFGFHERGRTQVSGTSTGLVAGFDGLRTAKTVLGAEHGLDAANAGLVYSEPLRVTGGTATFNVPTGVGADGSVERRRFSESVSPAGHERRIEAYYHREVSLGGIEQAALKLNASLRHEPDNVSDAPASTFVGAVFEGRF